MYARKDGVPLSMLPDDLVGADDAMLVEHGIYHIRESVPKDYDSNTQRLTMNGAIVGFDDDAPIPVVTLLWGVRPLTDEEEKNKKEVINGPTLEALTKLDSKRIRPLTDIALGVGDIVGSDGKTPRQRLIELEDEAKALRKQLVF